MTALLYADWVAYSYPQGRVGLEPVSLEAHAGDMLLVSGPSGCGKSTLARCLVGLIPHLYRGDLSGEVWVRGRRTHDTPLWRLSEDAGFVFQNPAAQLLGSSVEDEIIFGLENLGLPASVIEERLEQTLLQFDLVALRRRVPQTLSGGEQQRLGLAAVMARRPPLLVLDEPLSMLDCSASAALVSHLDVLRENGTAVVICEHRQEELQALAGLRALELDMIGSATMLPDAADTEEATAPFGNAAPFVLEVEDLSVTLGERKILHNVSFSVPGGQVVAIVGRNGVGKTTLLRAMAGLQRSTGRASVGGKRPDLTMVFQNPDVQLFNASVREEILYKRPEPDLYRYRWLMNVLGLVQYEATSPLLLSEGEKKRVALATALMATPRHGVLLDEPALGQDAGHKGRLIRLARAVAGTGRVVIMSTHDLSLAAQADRLLVLGREGIVADGAPDSVLRDSAAWAKTGICVPSWITKSIAKAEAAGCR